MGRRREERVGIRLPVRVWGMDKAGKPFMQTTHAIDVTRLGGRLNNLYCIEKIGDVIGVQHGNQKARYKVTWIGTPGSAEDGQVGIHLIEPEKYIWGNSIPKQAVCEDTYQVPAEFVDYQHHGAGYAGAGGSAAAAAAAMEAPRYKTRKKRVHPRYAATGTLQVLPEGGSLPVWATLNDISTSGCYAETVSPLPAQTRIRVSIKTLVGELHAKGVIRTSHHGVGMGITFTELGDQDRSRLNEFIEELVNNIPANSGTMNIGQDTQSPSGQKNGPSGMASRLHLLSIELREVEQSMGAGDVDARVLRAFRESMDHARQNIVFVQQWLHLQKESRDPDPVVAEINTERVQMTAERVHDLAMDIDAHEIGHSTDGLENLAASVASLHKRLTNLLKYVPDVGGVAV